MGPSPPLAVVLLLLAALACPGCGDPPASPSTATGGVAAPTVVLVTLDTTRADRIGAHGGPPGLTPRVDELARGGLVFDRAWSTHPITLPAHTSILTGTYPSAHGVHDNGLFRLEPPAVLLPEVLADEGWRTGAFVGAFVLDARYGLDQGFEVYDVPATRRLGQPLVGGERPADRVVDAALDWLGQVPADEPMFLWAHLFDAHFPYRPPPPFDRRGASAYEGEIAFADAQLGRLLDAVAASRPEGPRLVIVVGDHGEGLGEHGEAVHGVFVYDATLRVPLVVAGDGVPAGRVDAPVSVADVAPTVLDWLGLPRSALPDVRTPSLLATAAGAPDGDEAPGEERALPVESFLPYHGHGWHPVRGLVWRGWKSVHLPLPELFDLRADPHELENRAGSDAARLSLMAERLARLDTEHPALGAAARHRLDDEARAALQALGYTGGDADRIVRGDLPDPKLRLGQIARRDEALLLLWRGRRALGTDGVLAAPPPVDEAGAPALPERARELFEQARAILAALHAENPRDPEYAEYLGLVRLALGDGSQAVSLFEQVVAHRPRSAKAHHDLAVAHAHAGDEERAVAHMLRALTLEPRAVHATRWMADRHLARGEPGHAAWWLAALLGAEGGVGPVAPDDPAADEAEDALVAELTEALRDARAAAAAAGQGERPPPGYPARDFAPAPAPRDG